MAVLFTIMINFYNWLFSNCLFYGVICCHLLIDFQYSHNFCSIEPEINHIFFLKWRIYPAIRQGFCPSRLTSNK